LKKPSNPTSLDSKPDEKSFAERYEVMEGGWISNGVLWKCLMLPEKHSLKKERGMGFVLRYKWRSGIWKQN